MFFFASCPKISLPAACASHTATLHLLTFPMDSFFKIIFGFTLGIVSVLGWNYYETQQAFQKGLIPTWAPINPPPAPVPPAPVPEPPPPAPEPPPVIEEPPAPPVTQEEDDGIPHIGKTPEQVNAAIVALAAAPQRWPVLVSLTQDAIMPVRDGRKKIGEVSLTRGLSVGLLKVYSNGNLLVRSQGQVFTIPAEYTDILDQVLPEISNTYRAPVRQPKAETPAPEKTPSITTIAPGSTQKGTVFGVQISPDEQDELPSSR